MGNSFKPVAQTTTNADGTSTSLIPGPVTTEEKAQKKNDVKARSMLLMALSNEHLMTFNQYKDAKTLFAAIQTRFGCNDATKKNQKTLLKQLLLNKRLKELQAQAQASSSQNMAFVSSPSSTNEVNTAYRVSTANTQVSPASTQDLEQIHKDDIEEMDLKWQLALLSMRTIRFFQKTGRKITINRSDTPGYDKSKVKCFNCHKMVHFARECKGPRNQDSRNRNQDSSRRTVNVEETSSKAMVAIDGAGFDWSYMADDEVPTNMALMAFLDSEGYFSPPNLDLSNSGLEEFQQPEFEGYGPKTSKNVSEDTSNEVRESPDALMVEKLVSDDKLEKKTVFPTVAKIEFVRPKQQEIPCMETRSDFVMYNKACFVCGSFNHVRANCNYHQRERVVFGNNYSRVNYNYSTKKAHPSAYRNIVPRAVLMKTSLRPLNTARPVNTAHPKTTVYSARPMLRFSKSAQSTVKKPYQTRTSLTNKNFSQKVNTAKGSFYIARPKAVNTARPNSAVVNVVRANQGHPQQEEQGYVDSGCSRYMTGNMSYLLDFKEFDGGYVTFGGGEKGGKIIGKGTLKTGKATQSLLLMNKKYCLVVTDDYSRFTWVFFLASKDETSGILKSFITEIENLVDKKVKIIRCDNGTEFKNRVMSEFCEKKGIKKEFSVARTPQQNSVAERRNMTLIEAARTMLADSKLPTTFWAEAVNTACYVQNRVLVVKPHNKTPYELFRGRTPALSFMRPFGCHVTILNTLDYLGKFDGKFLEDKPIIAGDGPKWLFDIDILTKSMNYVLDFAGTNSNDFVDGSLFDSSSKNASNDELQPSSDTGKKDDDGVKVDMTNITTTYPVPFTLKTRIHKDHSLNHVISDVQSGVQTRRMTNKQGFISDVYEGKTLEDLHTCLFACFLSQEEPKRIAKALSDIAWVEAMQEELLHFKLQKVYIVVDLPKARIEAIRLFLAYASFMGFMVYQMDVKSAFLYGRIKEEVYVCQPPGFEDPDYPDKVYKVVKALYGLHQAPRAWYETLAKYLLDNGFYRGKIDQTLFIKKQKRDILLVQVYVDDIIFGSTKKELSTEFEKLMHDKFQMSSMGELTFFLGLQVKTTSTLMDTEKPLLKDSNGDDVDVHLYKSMIGSLMYLASSRLDIMYLKGQRKLGLWYPRDSSFDLVAYSDSDYAGANLDRKSTTGGYQFLGCRLISWQCKKQTVVATSSTKFKYVAAASCCRQVLWI
ncbi:retrovirus-related pol polyprotein from transposon TNT 1-94 [Tanacetum coccineum]|uniref:Retrovirus-related pol polyprotein from transposon TNT 1-94 n=1 Tax=Tanacetum coccineum TaxID=301880 RepID=A0ABQ5F6F2_9ASTR